MRIPRRELLGMAGGLVLGGLGMWMAQRFLWSGPERPIPREAPPFCPAEATDNLSPEEALARLEQANRRYLQKSSRPTISAAPHASLKLRPFAAIVTCSDSQVPPETVFDGCGDELFILRQFAHLLDPLSVDSLAYTVNYFRTPLILVLGHDNCQALSALLGASRPDAQVPPYLEPFNAELNSVVKEVQGRGGDEVEKAVEANIRQSVRQLRASKGLRSLIRDNHLWVRGARLDIPSGTVQLLDIA